jgi:hypothetical protein
VPPPALAPRPAIARTPTPVPPPATGFETNPETELAARRFEASPSAPAYPEPEAAKRDSSPALVASAPAAPAESVTNDPALTARGSLPAGDLAPVAQATSEAPSFVVATPVPAASASSDSLVPTPKRPRWWLVGGVGVLAAAAVVVVITTSNSDGGNPAPPPPAKPAAKQVAEVVPPPSRDPQPAVEAPEADEPPSAEGPPVVGTGPCKVVVVTTPAGSIVQLDGNSIGPSPITVAATCDKHKLDISHARYQSTSRFVSLVEGKPETVEVTLSRPTHIVTVTSTPPGATIFIDGRSAGTTPTKLSVLGFTTLKLEFKKTGYQPTSTKLYSKVAHDKVAVKLTKW